MSEPYALEVAASATRALGKIPERIRPAVVEFVTARLVENPQRIGKPLMGRFAGLYAARIQEYRVRYRIDEARRTVVVLHVGHRADAYRPD